MVVCVGVTVSIYLFGISGLEIVGVCVFVFDDVIVIVIVPVCVLITVGVTETLPTFDV